MSDLDDDTLSALFSSCGNSDARLISLRFQFAKTHKSRIEWLEKAIDLVSRDFSETRHHRLDRDEDELTIDLVSALTYMGIDAGHDLDVGGHCDVVVRDREGFLWLGEAKIHKDYAWLLKGFKQLTTRYSTGQVGQDVGGMIIYTRNKNALAVCEKWIEELGNNVSNLKIERSEENPILFSSFHPHQVSGLPYRVRHSFVLLHFDPEDR